MSRFMRIRSTFDLDLHLNCALESAEETEAQLARRRVRDRALRATQSTAQREALQRRS